MKKNITINLFGTLYAIDEDAYELLKKYQDNMHSYFRSKEGGEEIADDIEHRVAELLAELKAQGVEAVTIEQVEEIIHRIGNPEEMSGENNNEEGTPDKEEPDGDESLLQRILSRLKNRKLFRDGEDMVVGGVMSGLCHYFGGHDPLPWRIGMVLLCIFSFSTFAIIYLICWAFVPQARTAEERLQMQGCTVNTSTLNREIIRGMNKAREEATAVGSHARSLMGTIISILGFCFKGFILITCCALLIPLLFGLAGIVYATIHGTQSLAELLSPAGDAVFLTAIPGLTWQLWILLAATAFCVCIPIYVCIRWMSRRNNSERLSGNTRATLFFVWLACLVIAAATGIFIAIEGKHTCQALDRENNTHNGIYLEKSSWQLLDREGWKAVIMKNCEPYALGREEHPLTGYYHEYIRLRPDEYEKGRMTYRLERETTAQAGLYIIEGLVRTNSRGHYLYALNGQNGMMLTEIPLFPHNRSNLSTMTYEEARRIPYFASVTDSISWEPVMAADNEWNYVASDTLRHTGGALRYGFTNDPDLTHHTGYSDRISVMDLVLTRIGDLPLRTH